MAKAPALHMMPFWVGDWLASTRHMSPGERALFFDLLCHQWMSGPLAQDVDRLARLGGVSVAEFFKMWDAVAPMFPVQPDNTLANERLERERRTSLAMRKNAHERAKLGGESTKERWEKDREGMAARKAASIAASHAASHAQARLDPMLEPRLGDSSLSASASVIYDPPSQAREARISVPSEPHSGAKTPPEGLSVPKPNGKGPRP